MDNKLLTFENVKEDIISFLEASQKVYDEMKHGEDTEKLVKSSLSFLAKFLLLHGHADITSDIISEYSHTYSVVKYLSIN